VGKPGSGTPAVFCGGERWIYGDDSFMLARKRGQASNRCPVIHGLLPARAPSERSL